jgi:hypothetical protein
MWQSRAACFHCPDSMPTPSARDRFLELLGAAVREGTLTKLTLGKYRGTDATLKNLFVRPVALKAGPHLSFVWRHQTRDVTKNHPVPDALALLESLIGRDFLDAHLFTPVQNAQFESDVDGKARLRLTAAAAPAAGRKDSPPAHDRAKAHLIPAAAPWLHELGVTNDRGQPQRDMADKFRQIQKFAELLQHLVSEAWPEKAPPRLEIADMGSGKGYLTFAVAELFRERARVRGIEVRRDLVDLCNRVAQHSGLASVLGFEAGAIADTQVTACDVLIALHACDTATDDALARGIGAGARLLVVAPCCQKELRRQLRPPAILESALQHGIFQERQAEFVTDALRAQLLEWAGYRTKVFEFISTEHTAKNLMIAAIKAPAAGRNTTAVAERTREFAGFYGIREQRLAALLGFPLAKAS